MRHRDIWLLSLAAILVLAATLGALFKNSEHVAADQAIAPVDAEQADRENETAPLAPTSRDFVPASGDGAAAGATSGDDTLRPQATPEAMSGRFVFLDGSPVPLQRIEFVRVEQQELPKPEPLTALTEWDGSFRVKAPSGDYRARLVSSASVLREDSLVTSPAENAVVRVDGVGLGLRILDGAGNPISGATIQLTDGPLNLSAHSNRDGLAAVVMARSLRTNVEARKDQLSGELGPVDVPSEAHLVVRDLTLLPPIAVGRVSVVVRTSRGVRLNDFSVRLIDETTHEQVRFLRSVENDSDGTFSGVPVGSYRATLAPAYWGPPELFDSGKALARQVTVAEGATATIAFDVEAIGRLRVRVIRPDAPPDREATLRLRDAQGQTRSLGCRIPGENDTVTVTDVIPLNEAYFIEEVVADGTYTIVAKVREFGEDAVTVHVTSGTITEVTLRPK